MLETETVLDRRRLRRSVTLWRALGVGGVALALVALVFGNSNVDKYSTENQIARVTIEGTITESRDQLKMLKEIEDADHVKGVLLFVNSPGGTTAGGEALFEALRNVAKKKPVVAQFGTIAASAGYIVGLACDHIVARGNTITGSVGVIFQWPEFKDLLDKLGVKVNEVKSGTLKAAPSVFEPINDQSRKVIEAMIADGFKWFAGLVEDRRGIKVADVPGLVEGRIFSGREALQAKLIDQIGGERDAVAWLETTKNISKDLKVIDWKPEKGGAFGYSFFGHADNRSETLIVLGVKRLVQLIAGDTGQSTLGLDGLLSVWHPTDK